MKAGIMTMHKVLNYGSALQAYALQRKLMDLGVENEIIDYEFPLKSDIPFISRMNTCLREFVFRLRTQSPLLNTKSRKFHKFYQKYLKLSPESCNRLNIITKQFDYDVYITGSDQVWNPTFIKNDTNFFLSFAPDDRPRLSYAASFAVDEIPEDLMSIYSEHLGKYDKITVRENTGVPLVKRLTGKTAVVACDPTLLLAREHYLTLAYKAHLDLPDEYILVYMLTYMYNPYPEVNRIIKNIHDTLDLPVIYLDGSKFTVYDKSCPIVSDLDPCEFIEIFSKASFVITSSFHGTAFSLILKRPFISILKEGVKDSRIKSLLSDTHCENSIVYHNEDFIPESDISKYICDDAALSAYREQSIEILYSILEPYL